MKYLAILFILILIIGSAFALTATTTVDKKTVTIDSIQPSTNNLKTYYPSWQQATITDISSNPIATVRLLTPTHNQVGLGYQKVAEMEINSLTSYANFFKTIYTFDLKNGSRIIPKSFDIKEQKQTTTAEPSYKTVCDTPDLNGKTSCKETINGTINITRTSYVPFDEATTWTGTKIISLWTTVEPNDHVEWIPDLFGTTINEWATWDTNANVNLLGYWKLDEVSGTMVNSVNTLNNCTPTNITQNVTGIINAGAKGTNASTSKTDCGSGTDLNIYGTISINAWAYPVYGLNEASLVGRVGTSGGTTQYRLFLDIPSKKVKFGIAGTGVTPITSDSTYDSNAWNMITATWTGGTDVNGMKIYKNGVLIGAGTYGGGAQRSADKNTYLIGDSINEALLGTLDEVGIWNRALTANDINNIYNAGTGLSYPYPFTLPEQARITFNVYRKGTSTNLTGITMDSNIDTLDLNGQNSPFSTIYYTAGTNADGNFTRTGYDYNKISFYMDTNKTITVYLTDSTAPSLGQTVVSGFSLSGSRISGTGIVSVPTTDTGSDINATGCAFTANNGSTWTYGIDYNGTHCYKSYTITNGTTPQFNFKTYDNANNARTQTATQQYQSGNYIFVRVYDENSFTALSGVNMNFAGTDYTITQDQNFALTSYVQGTNYTITFSKTGYGTRYYQFDINQNQDLNLNFMLLINSLGTNLTYKLYNSTGDTALPNTYFEMQRPDKNNFSITRIKTDASANATIFTNIFDQNYSELVGDVNTYAMVNLSVLYPKDEDTQAQISNYWKITMSGALSTLYQNLNATKSVYLIPNLITPYNLLIKDMNTSYFARNYAESFAGNPLTATLQPYLISTSSGVQTNIKSLNPSTLKVVPTINIKIYKQLLGTKTLVEEVVTSDTGDASTTLTTNQTYYFDVYQNGVFLSEQTITGPTLSGTTIYIYVGGSGFIPPVNPASFLNVGCYPGNTKLNKFDTNLAQIILLNNFGAGVAIQSIFIYVTNHDSNGFDNNIYYKSITTSSNYTNSIVVDPNNFTLDGNVLQKYDSNGSMTIYTTVTTNTGTSQYTCQVSPYSGFNIQTSFGYNLRPFFGCPLTNDPLVPCPTLLIAALFVSLTISVLLSMSMGYASMNTIGFMFIFIMGIFTYITWVPYILFGIMLAGTIGLILAEVGRQRL